MITVKCNYSGGKMISVICNFRGVKMIAVICNFTVTGAPGEVTASYFRGRGFRVHY
jgi:hypothetical protein